MFMSRYCLASALLALPLLAHAQKPALTKDVDAKGRTPFIQTFAGDQSTFGCANTCTLNFTQVPAGYRLVVTYISAEYAVEYGPASVVINNGPASATNTKPVALSTPTPTILNPSATFKNCIISTPIDFYFEPGDVPKVTLSSGGFQNVGGVNLRVTLVGYLISLS